MKLNIIMPDIKLQLLTQSNHYEAKFFSNWNVNIHYKHKNINYL